MESKFFSNEVVNKGRQNEFDWAKAFTIIVMVTVHVYELLGVFDPEKRGRYDAAEDGLNICREPVAFDDGLEPEIERD